jgi:mono/diheme cytochrome c family protein
MGYTARSFRYTVAGTITIAVLLLLLVVSSFTYTSAASQLPPSGEGLYKQYCIRCHGTDGTKGMLGAKDLRRSTLPDSAIVLKIKRGKGFMPAFQKKMTTAALQQVMLYVKTLRPDQANTLKP